ncbi:MAG: NAD-dependent epimerase/dehydratase family protein [Candidatus Nanohaloarchaea archaeon]|nr:NAD-dependent epimerase/dehydratase family protein [Candidatus Nanohaloarchaea archaeon]
MRVLVAGANGFVGQHLIPELEEQHDVVALDRDRYDGDCSATVEADLTEYDDFAAALEDVDAAYYLVHSMTNWGDFTETERRCAENFRRSCDEHGVDRVIYLTGIVPEGELSDHLASRKKVADILGSGDADLTELRASIILGEGSASFRIMKQLVERLPVMVAPRWLSSRSQPIHIDDAVYYLDAVLDQDATRTTWYDIGGPDTHTYLELLRILADEMGKTPVFLPAPVLTPRLSSYWLKLVTDVPYPLARALVESLREDMVVGKPIEDVIDHDCLGYREAVREILD